MKFVNVKKVESFTIGVAYNLISIDEDDEGGFEFWLINDNSAMVIVDQDTFWDCFEKETTYKKIKELLDKNNN